MADNPYQSPNPKESEQHTLRDVETLPAAGATVFFILFFIATLVFGGWMMCYFSFGDGSGKPLRTIGLVLGVLCSAASFLPLYFASSLVRGSSRRTTKE